jgi:hypothetical protein
MVEGGASCEARGMNYEEFKELWTWALRESGLPIGGVMPIEESLDLRSTDRRCKSVVHAHDRAATFHASAALGFHWDALQTARTPSTEEDAVRQLFGVDRGQYPRTEVPWLRVDVTLHANTEWGKEIPLPSAEVWKNWTRETIGRLENIEPLLPIEQVRENRKGNLEILAFRSDPELNVLSKPDGSLVLRGVEARGMAGHQSPAQVGRLEPQARQGTARAARGAIPPAQGVAPWLDAGAGPPRTDELNEADALRSEPACGAPARGDVWCLPRGDLRAPHATTERDAAVSGCNVVR